MKKIPASQNSFPMCILYENGIFGIPFKTGHNRPFIMGKVSQIGFEELCSHIPFETVPESLDIMDAIKRTERHLGIAVFGNKFFETDLLTLCTIQYHGGHVPSLSKQQLNLHDCSTELTEKYCFSPAIQARRPKLPPETLRRISRLGPSAFIAIEPSN